MSPSLRDLLFALGGVSLGATAGIALGYRYRAELRGLKLRLLARPYALPDEAGAFGRDAAAIIARRNCQTRETVATLKARYEHAVLGRVRVWDLVEKLGRCIDPTDLRLFGTSQLVHVQQVVAAMERNGVADRDLLLLAVVHDLGKILLLEHEAPENVVGVTARVAGGEPGAGLDSVVFQFGHGEFIYSRIRDHVPDHVAWTARYHNLDPRQAEPFLNPREREWAARYLIPFQRFDNDFASPYYLPSTDWARLRRLVEEAFPQPIVV